MSEIKNGGLDQYGAEPFEQQQSGTVGIGGAKLATCLLSSARLISYRIVSVFIGRVVYAIERFNASLTKGGHVTVV